MSKPLLLEKFLKEGGKFVTGVPTFHLPAIWKYINKYCKQEVGHKLSFYMLNLLPKVHTLPSFMAISLVKDEI